MAPTGWIPRYDDLAPLFRQVLGKEYSVQDYVRQFTVRIPENLAKIDRVEAFHRKNVTDAPEALFVILDQQRARLTTARKRFGDYVSPQKFIEARS